LALPASYRSGSTRKRRRPGPTVLIGREGAPPPTAAQGARKREVLRIIRNFCRKDTGTSDGLAFLSPGIVDETLSGQFYRMAPLGITFGSRPIRPLPYTTHETEGEAEVCRAWGAPDVLQLESVPPRALRPGEVRIRADSRTSGGTDLVARRCGTDSGGIRRRRHIGHGREACVTKRQHGRDKHRDDADHPSAHPDRIGVIGTETPMLIHFWGINRLVVHGASVCFATAGSCKVNVTFEFCRSLYWPLTTTRSPSVSPDAIATRPSVVGPGVIGRALTTSPSPTTQANLPSGPVWMAAEGTVRAPRSATTNVDSPSLAARAIGCETWPVSGGTQAFNPVDRESPPSCRDPVSEPP
jgi:hypothetical protein